MAQRKISTRISLDGEQEFKRQLTAVNGELRNLKGEMSLTTEEFKGNANSLEALTEKSKLLRREVDQQEEKVKALEQAVKDSSQVYGEADSRTDKYRQSLTRAKTDLIKMQRELQDTDKYMEEAEQSADKMAKSIDGFGKEAKDASKDLDGLQEFDFGSLLDGLKSLQGVAIGGALAAGAKELADGILEVEESTREYRQIMGTLEVSSQAAGYAAEETAAAYEYLYGVMGDTQTTATTIANLQAIGLSQEDLMAVVDAATGAWATYGDSIPIDSLAESINETVKSGEVTGTFADVLNWGAAEGENFGVKMRASTEANKDWNEAVKNAKTAEDFFNLALSQCGTESERADLILQAMAKQGLADTGKAWRDVNDDIVKVNESQRKWDEATGKLGETLAPAADAIRDFGADAINWLADQLDKAIESAKNLWDWLTKDTEATAASEMRGQGFRPYGSYATGLDRVPFDNFPAYLHKDEAVLTAKEAMVWRTLQREPQPVQRGVSPQDLRQVTSAAINAVGRAAPVSGDLQVDLVVNGTKLAGAILPDFRRVSAAHPEVMDD